MNSKTRLALICIPAQAGLGRLLLSGAILLLTAQFAAFAGDSNLVDSPGRPAYPFAQEAPAVGSMNGVKLSIPRNYLLSGLLYKGEDPWSGRTRSFTPTLDSSIEDFSLRLRMSTRKPVQSAQDWADYFKQGWHGVYTPDNTWITVSVEPEGLRNGGKNGLLRSVFEGWRKDEAHWGPWVRERPDVYGLQYYVSRSPHGMDSTMQPNEIFYDAGTEKTFISCANGHRKAPPHDPTSFCQHLFVVPELKAVASVNYVVNKDFLPP